MCSERTQCASLGSCRQGFEFIYGAEDAHGAYNGLPKIIPWMNSVEPSYRVHLRSARQADDDKQTACLITVMLRSGKYA
eukprot:jgi/Chrzof1/4575/Cz14g18250.t1